MAITIGFDKAPKQQGGQFEPMPAGEYEGLIKSVEVKHGKTSGKPYLSVCLELTEADVSGRRAYSNYSLQPQALWKLKELLLELGWDEAQLEAELDLEPAELMGTPVTVELGDPTGNSTWNEVVSVKAA